MRGRQVPPAEPDPPVTGGLLDVTRAMRAAESRGETLDQVLDRNVVELLQELRVAFTGVQILFAFLLGLAFTSRFQDLEAFDLGVYTTCLMTSALATLLLIAPVSFHRMVFRRRQKAALVAVADRMLVVGLALLVPAIASAVLLILDVALGRVPALVSSGFTVLVGLATWYALPLAVRRSGRGVTPQDAHGDVARPALVTPAGRRETDRMTTTRPGSRERARIAEHGEGIGLDELGLATRNHGMPLEALRYDVTPPGLHYVLVHYDIPAVDPGAWRLEIGGAVARPLSLSLPELTSRPAVTARVLLECAGNGRARLDPRPVSQPWLLEAVGSAEWTGTPLAPLLEEAGLRPDAVDVAFTGADHGVERGVEQDYTRGLSVAEAMRPDALLVWAMNGQPLPPQHGAPLRLLVPGWYGMAQVKWLTRIEVLDRPFDGYQNETAYRLKVDADDPGEPVTRIRPRALLAPPGWPDFLSRERFVRPGRVVLTGRAWSGRAPLTAVEVSTDGGASWAPAELAPADPVHPYAWRAWTYAWDASPGATDLLVRAADAEGAQPVEQEWNRQGMANNLVQRVPVTVLDQA